VLLRSFWLSGGVREAALVAAAVGGLLLVGPFLLLLLLAECCGPGARGSKESKYTEEMEEVASRSKGCLARACILQAVGRFIFTCICDLVKKYS